MYSCLQKLIDVLNSIAEYAAEDSPVTIVNVSTRWELT